MTKVLRSVLLRSAFLPMQSHSNPWQKGCLQLSKLGHPTTGLSDG